MKALRNVRHYRFSYDNNRHVRFLNGFRGRPEAHVKWVHAQDFDVISEQSLFRIVSKYFQVR